MQSWRKRSTTTSTASGGAEHLQAVQQVLDYSKDFAHTELVTMDSGERPAA